ncbi:MAG: TauD/TfdA family dioxygenase, partial [Actinomycetota bacterium]
MALTDRSSPPSATELEVHRLAPALGAEVRGLRLADAGPAEIDTINALLLEHMVLFFPEQHLTLDEHVAFGAQLGPLEGHPNLLNPFTE